MDEESLSRPRQSGECTQKCPKGFADCRLQECLRYSDQDCSSIVRRTPDAVRVSTIKGAFTRELPNEMVSFEGNVSGLSNQGDG